MLTNCIKQYPLTILTATTICVLSVIPVPEVKMAEDIPLVDKWVHFVMYGGLSAVTFFELYRNYCKGTQNKKKREATIMMLLCTFIVPSLYGGLLELVQKYLTTCRSGDWIDFIADAIGAALGSLLGLIVVPHLVRKLTHM